MRGDPLAFAIVEVAQASFATEASARADRRAKRGMDIFSPDGRGFAAMVRPNSGEHSVGGASWGPSSAASRGRIDRYTTD